MELCLLFAKGLFNGPITSIFTVAMLFLLANALSCKIWDKAFFKWSRNLAAETKGLLITIGIFGTFVGIFLALIQFDATRIDASVPKLLDGMKLAFSTSVLGMFGAILIGALVPVFSKRGMTSARPGSEVIVEAINNLNNTITIGFESVKKEQSLGFSTMVGAQMDATSLQRAGNERNLGLLEEIKKCLVGDDDASLATQLRRFRQDSLDGQKDMKKLLEESFQEIRKQFEDFGKTLAESNSKALMEALQEVIRDFNTKLTEQFGENFKQLNQAVGELLHWQETYRGQMQQMVNQFELCVLAVEACKDSLNLIRKDAESIPPTLDKLRVIIEAMDAQLATGKSTLEAFLSLREKAGEVFPAIEENVRLLTSGLKEKFDTVGDSLKQSVEDTTITLASANRTYIKGLEEITEGTEKTVTNLLHSIQEDLEETVRITSGRVLEFTNTASDEMKRASTTLASKMQEITQDLQTEIKRVAKNLEDYGKESNTFVTRNAEAAKAIIENYLRQSNEMIRNELKSFDSAMEQELQKAISQLGSKLASLSNKFVQDYEPLTKKLQEVVHIAEAVGVGGK